MDILATRPNLLFLIAIRVFTKRRYLEDEYSSSDEEVPDLVVNKEMLYQNEIINLKNDGQHVDLDSEHPYSEWSCGFLMPRLEIVSPKLRTEIFYDRFMSEYTVYTKHESHAPGESDFVLDGNRKGTLTIVNTGPLVEVNEEWRVCGVYHRKNGPAHIYTDYAAAEDGLLDFVPPLTEYYYAGELHRTDGPASVDIDVDGDLTKQLKEEYYIHGQLHRTDGPAYVFRNGECSVEQWYINGELHRKNGPAIEEKDFNVDMQKFVIKKVVWYKKGQIHRKNKPAIKVWIAGINTARLWYRHDLRHREHDKPAQIIKHGKKLNKLTRSWFLNGKLTRTTKRKGRILPAVIFSITDANNTDRIVRQIWAKNGKTHSFKYKGVRQPGTILYDTRGKVVSQCWFKNGDYHRYKGPAIINDNGHREWYLNGQIIKKIYSRMVVKNARKGKSCSRPEQQLHDTFVEYEI